MAEQTQVPSINRSPPQAWRRRRQFPPASLGYSRSGYSCECCKLRFFNQFLFHRLQGSTVNSWLKTRFFPRRAVANQNPVSHTYLRSTFCNYIKDLRDTDNFCGASISSALSGREATLYRAPPLEVSRFLLKASAKASWVS